MSDKTRTFLGFIVVVIVLTIISYKYYFTGYDCVKVKLDGSVHCSCEFNDKEGWHNFKNLLGSNWEPVTFPSGYDPCEGFKNLNNETNTTQSQSSSYEDAVEIQDESAIRKDTVSTASITELPKGSSYDKVAESPRTDTVPLLRDGLENEKPGYYLSNRLPLSYTHRNLKFTFYKDGDLIKVKCYDDGELYNTFTCTLNNNVLNIENAEGFFAFSDGQLTLVYPEERKFLGLYMAKD